MRSKAPGRAVSSVRRARDPVEREPEPSSSGTGDDEPSAGRCSSERARASRFVATGKSEQHAIRATREEIVRVGKRRARASQPPLRYRGARVEGSRAGVFFSDNDADTRMLTIRFRAWTVRTTKGARGTLERRQNEDAHFGLSWRSRVSRYTRARCRGTDPAARRRSRRRPPPSPRCSRWCVLVAAAAAGDGARATHSILKPLRGVTSAFQRPPAQCTGPRGRACAPRALEAVRCAPSDSFDAPEQVHLLPGGPNEMVVVWASASIFGRGPGERLPRRRRSARGGARSGPRRCTPPRTPRMCLGESMSVDPAMGDRHPVDLEALVALANTSAWGAPRRE